MGFTSSIGSMFSGMGSSFVGPPTLAQSTTSSIFSGLSKFAGAAGSIAGLVAPVLQTKSNLDSRLAEYKAQLEADTQANILAIEGDAKAREAANIEADLMLEDALVAQREEREVARKASATQRMGYLKSGVQLDGSPLIVLEETYQKGEENARNVMRGARRRADLVRRKGELTTPMITRANLDVTKAGMKSDVAGGISTFSTLFKQLV